MTNKKDSWKIFIGVAIFYILGMIGYAIVTNLKPIGNWFLQTSNALSQNSNALYIGFMHTTPYSFIGLSVYILVICGMISYIEFSEYERPEQKNAVRRLTYVAILLVSLFIVLVI